MLNRMLILMNKNPKFKISYHLRISRNKNLPKNILQIGQKKFLLLVKFKRQFHGPRLLVFKW